jgi:hypothetical protein
VGPVTSRTEPGTSSDPEDPGASFANGAISTVTSTPVLIVSGVARTAVRGSVVDVGGGGVADVRPGWTVTVMVDVEVAPFPSVTR